MGEDARGEREELGREGAQCETAPRRGLPSR